MVKKNRTAFVIMQIGNEELDKIYSDIYYPAIKAANLEPKRIDIDNEGNLLKKEIIENIEKAEIIIADLTNERPNCYLEVGYAMGIDKYKNLIFTVREDHYMDSPNYKKGGLKIHFDVTGYDILFWDSLKLDDFKTKLIERISRRLLVISPNIKKDEKKIWDESWIENQRNYVRNKLEKNSFTRYSEVLVTPLNSNLNILQNELLEIADNSQIQTFGWPIGIVFKNVPDLRPISKTDGIVSEIEENTVGYSYDFSYFKKNGQIFLTKSLYEETNYKDSILVEVRIKRVTELLMYLSRFYSKCNLPKNERLKISIKYTGLVKNSLRFPNSGLMIRNPRTSNENECTIEIITSLLEIESKLPEKVHEIVNNLFVLFDFYIIELGFVRNIVNEFIDGTNNANR